MLRNYFNKILLVFVFALISIPAHAQRPDFNIWLKDMRAKAAAAGISQATINANLYNIMPSETAIKLDKKQPEKKKTFAEYKTAVVNENRVQQGRKLIQQHYSDLQAVETQYGVPKEFIVALWGIETNYGGNTGGFSVIGALATMAWEGRREEFFTKELINALKIIDAGHIKGENMKGSWAGAMGQNQFMPSSFNAYAVDGNGDGKRDIWGTKKDVFASSANYLKKNGWKAGERWGQRVTLPANFPKNLITPKITKRISEWASLGVMPYAPYGQQGWPKMENIDASIVAPDGLGGEAYIVYNNYQTIMDWNRSTYFATSVGLLADRLSQ